MVSCPHVHTYTARLGLRSGKDTRARRTSPAYSMPYVWYMYAIWRMEHFLAGTLYLIKRLR